MILALKEFVDTQEQMAHHYLIELKDMVNGWVKLERISVMVKRLVKMLLYNLSLMMVSHQEDIETIVLVRISHLSELQLVAINNMEQCVFLI